MKSNTCYICCCWLGERRSTTDAYRRDRLAYVKEQIKTLSNFNHSLGRIVFVFNLEEEHLDLFKEANELIPDFINGSPVTVISRENVGLSYGAWSDVFGMYREKYDYYIFNEDDYFVNQHDFDTYMVNKFNSMINVGYLCLLTVNPSPHYPWDEVHAGNSVGISSTKVLNELWEIYGMLPHAHQKNDKINDRYAEAEQGGQIGQTNAIFKMGYNIFDTREDYATPHDMGDSGRVEGYDHIVEVYFYQNPKYLFVPAVMQFQEPYFHIDIVDGQFKPKKTCYVVNMYFGPRRRTIEDYDKDRLCFLKKQIETLSKYYHNLDRIVFSINFSDDQLNYVNEALNLIPKKIQNANVEVFLRENKGLSYGAFSDNFKRLREEYDYFIFNEDDYFLVENNWDEYLIRKYNQLPDSGYLCAIQRDEDLWNDYKIHAGHCFGIASTESLNKVWDEYNCLPHSNDTNDYKVHESVQHEFGYAFIKVGLRVYDIREEYRVAFALTPRTDGFIDNADIWRWFWWNERDFIIPAIFAFGKSYTWWESYDGPCIRKTNLEKYE
jgi:hypothetical protein